MLGRAVPDCCDGGDVTHAARCARRLLQESGLQRALSLCPPPSPTPASPSQRWKELARKGL